MFGAWRVFGRRAAPRRGRRSRGALVLAAVALVTAASAPELRASEPLVVTGVQRDAIGDLAIDGSTSGWAFTRDGRHVYVGSSGLIAHLAPDPSTGALTFLDAVAGYGGYGMLALGPDEADLYYTRGELVAVFRRDPLTGALALLQAVWPPYGGGALAVAPEGRHIIVASGPTITVYVRRVDGTLGLVLARVPGLDGIRSLLHAIGPLAISPDGRFVYALEHEGPEQNGDAVLIFARDVVGGALERVQRVADGFDDYVALGGLQSLVASPDGRDLIVSNGTFGRGGVVTFRLDDAGARVVRARAVGRAPGALPTHLLAVSSDGALVFAAEGDVLKVWRRDPVNADHELLQVLSNLAGDADTPRQIGDLAASADGRFVYVTALFGGAVTVLRRRCGDGVVEADEACDDANLSSGDGCDATCRVEPCHQCAGVPSVCAPAGGPCDDGNPCTDGDACTAGRCSGTAAADGLVCDDGNPCTTGDACRTGTCVPSGRKACDTCAVCDREMAECVGTVERGCARPPAHLIIGKLAPGTLRRPPVGRFRRAGGGKLRIDWRSDDPAAADGIGDPFTATGYTVCHLDRLLTDTEEPRERQRRRVVAQARVPANAECRGMSCWHRGDAGELSYRSVRGKPNGVRSLQLAPPPAGGLDLDVAARDGVFRRVHRVVGPLTAQIFADGGACWQGELTTPKASKR
jgi:cysteine-rich repeat protein